MKLNLWLCSCLLLLTPIISQASPVLTTGTPANSLLSTPTGASPALGNLINFDSLTPFSTFNPSTYSAQGVTSISSPDGLLVDPFSTQTSPNFLFDNSLHGTANITIALAKGVNAIGIGIADSDPVTITLQTLGAGGVNLGSPFLVNLATMGSVVNPGNGYFVVGDSSSDIFGLQITQSVANANYSGLAIDDLQFAPEPSTFLLVAGAVAIIGSRRLRKRA